MSQFTPTDTRIYNLISEFKIDDDIASVRPFGSGHINDTYRIVNSDPVGVDYLLQRINHHVFKDVPALMQNLLYVTRHLKQKLSQIHGSDLEKEVITIVETHDGQPYFKDSEGNYWRVFHFLKNTRSYDQVTTEQQAYEGGKAFGRFQALLADLDTSLIKDTIPDFHNIEWRLVKLEQAVVLDKVGKLSEVSPEVEFIRQRTGEMS
ncbi:MAG TPA: phosphotransferase, partial [Mucilaginibacter sp.]|nr:phosphotransferase [Mucilaginibacter sp.]